MPSPLSMNVTPAGSVPLDVIAAAGLPAVVTVKVPALPTANVVVAALVKRRPSQITSRADRDPGAQLRGREEAGQLAAGRRRSGCGRADRPGAPRIRSTRPSPSMSPVATDTPPANAGSNAQKLARSPRSSPLNTRTCGPPPGPGAGDDVAQPVTVQIAGGHAHAAEEAWVIGEEARQDTQVLAAEDLHMRDRRLHPHP